MNLKRIVWHKAFEAIVKSIEGHAKSGFYKRCGDNILRILYPLILILSADYEEQYVALNFLPTMSLLKLIYSIRCFMAVIRGLRSARPCPVCLISSEDLSDLSIIAARRTPTAMKKIYDEAKKLNKKDQEELLKAYGLRNVEVSRFIYNFDLIMAVLTISADAIDNFNNDRIHSGRSSTQMCMLPFPGIGFTRTMGAYSPTIYGRFSKKL